MKMVKSQDLRSVCGCIIMSILDDNRQQKNTSFLIAKLWWSLLVVCSSFLNILRNCIFVVYGATF